MSSAGPIRKTKASKDDWETPKHILDWRGHKVGPFDLDVAASAKNHKFPKYYTEEDSCFDHDWFAEGARIAWCNPPYGDILNWVNLAIDQASKGCFVEYLIPNSVETQYFERIFRVAEAGGATIEILKGRITFEYEGKPEPGNPCGSLIVDFYPYLTGAPKNFITLVDWKKECAALGITVPKLTAKKKAKV